MGKGKIKIIGFTVSITWIMFIAVSFFIKSLDILWGEWFATYAMYICIVSGVVVLMGILTGSIALGRIMSKGKGLL